MLGIEWFLRWSPKDAAYCKADWKLYLGEDYGAVEPNLERVTGRVTGSYPGADGNIRYEVQLHGEFWLGIPYDGGEESEEAPWPKLTVEDVQLWRISSAGLVALTLRSAEDGGKRARETGNNGRPKRTAPTWNDTKDVRVSPDYKVVRIGKRRIDLSRKPKARAFLRFVRERNGGREFQVEEMRDEFNAQFGDETGRKGWYSDRLREDLFKGLGKGEFDLLFDTVNQTAGIYRLKI